MSETDPITTRPDTSQRPEATPCIEPAVDISEDHNGITLWADMPGVSKEQLSIHVKENTLTIEGTISFGLPDGLESIHAEITYPRYRRQFTLSRDLDADAAMANLEMGVLKLRIPKITQDRSKRIDIRVM
ncbi:Hsp20/alpha crystallin family protein [Allopusillimonas ginsengisoli]|uniref:Hsp20/alpha crystallin family protein n=1 Tax=Allopusillimonas ginsengisoli TaxID=453575 RepID=UPI0010C15A01|nr:Hsp20/alpha crystallin family protein [Allopusillimonas ginsengisoli]